MSFLIIASAVVLVTAISAGAQQNAEYLGDNGHLISFSQQAWGELGLNTCAHAAGQTPLRLWIRDKQYAKGLGHHAPGEIVVDLEAKYDTFEAEVGVQKQDQGMGSVIFQVYVDDEKAFDSGVMRESDAARPISIPVRGAQELLLVVTDAGDGMTCDCGNWANARLIPSTSPAPARHQAGRVDIAPFAQVVTCDPNRMDGARASRVQEFRAEDVFLETELAQSSGGVYALPANGCIGLKWMERRLLTDVGLRFAGSAPSSDGVQVQAWLGSTSHQGEWKPLKGTIQASDDRWTFPISLKDNPDARVGMWKVRWVFPVDQSVRIQGFTAYSRSLWKTANLVVELEEPLPGKRGAIEVYNGELIGETGDWSLDKPMSLQVRYSTSKRVKYDRTVLRFTLPSDAFGVAVDDVLESGCIYVRDAGLFIRPTDSKLTLADYKRQIAGRKTILERVREMPDQTFEQAMAKTRNPVQDNGPTMLSLACDNHKYVMEQSGIVRFALTPQGVNPVSYDEQVPCAMVPSIGGEDVTRVERHAEGGWLPIIVSTWRLGDVIYQERCFVAPYDKTDKRLWLNAKPVCVTEFTVENTGSAEADASLGLTFLADAVKNVRATIDSGVVRIGDRVAAVVGTNGLTVVSADGRMQMAAKLEPGATARCTVYMPGWSPSRAEIEQLSKLPDLVDETTAYWECIMADAMQIEIPEKMLEEAIKASQVHCMIAARNEDNGSRVAAWAGADRYGALESESNSIIRGMDLMGQSEFARRSHDFFIKRYDPAGFLTTGYTLIGTGWQLQTLGQHYDLARDKDWWRAHSSDVARVCEWIIKQRHKTMKLDAHGQKVPEYGLIPPGVQADWGNFLPYFCLSGYYCAGLREAGQALLDIGHPDATRFVKEAESFRGDILDAYRRAQARTPVVPMQDGTWVKAYPSEAYHAGPLGDFFPGEDGNRSWCYDVELGAHQLVQTGVLDPRSKEAAEMTGHMEDVQFLSDGWFDYPAAKNRADWFNLGGFSKVQPYYTRNGENYALADDIKPFIRSYFNTIAAMLCTENMTLWEHFHNVGAWNKTHETGYFLQQSRFMLVMEHGDKLYLAPFVTSNWLRNGMIVSADDAPTNFGKVSYKITSYVKHGFIEAAIVPPTRNAPREIVIRLRHPEGRAITSVTVNGNRHTRFDPRHETVTLGGPFHGEIRVVARY